MRSFGRNNPSERENLNPQQRPLAVTPLNSMPYIGPPSPPGNPSSSSLPTQAEDDAADGSGPTVIFLPSNAPQEEVENLAAQTQTGVVLTGSAATGMIGPSVGAVNIGENEDSYYFRVNLPGVSTDEKDFSFTIDPDGTVFIKGITTTGEKTVCKHSQVFRMLSQNLCPPGHFTVTIQLPGPVNNQEFKGHFGTGILEGVVKKRLA